MRCKKKMLSHQTMCTPCLEASTVAEDPNSRNTKKPRGKRRKS